MCDFSDVVLKFLATVRHSSSLFHRGKMNLTEMSVLATGVQESLSGWTHTAVLLVATCYLVSFYMRRGTPCPNVPKGYTSPPGPRGLPVIGNLHQLGTTPHLQLTALWRRYGHVYSLQMGAWPTVVLNGLDTIRRALVKQAEDFAGRPDFYTFRYIGNGKSMGFGDYGPRWKMHRKIAQNALGLFVNDRHHPMEDAILGEARTLVGKLQTLGSDCPVDPHQEIYLSVGSIICVTCFGRQYKRDDEEFVRLIQMNDEFMAYAGAGNPVDVLPWTRHLTKRSFQSFVGILRAMDDFCDKKHAEHMKTYDPSRMRDVTDALIQSTKAVKDSDKAAVGLTDSHILTTVQEIIAAGFDTIATTLHWAVLFMITHPEAQKRAQKEIDDLVGKERSPRVKDMGSLPYTEACVYETLRHSCIFPLGLPHSTTTDTLFGDFFIPDKTLVFTNLWSITRDPSVFPEPELFKPERFLTPAGQLDRSVVEHFLPFSAGRRRCPGEPLARMEIFLFFTSLIHKCHLEPVPGTQYSLQSKFGLTLKPRDFKLKVTPRL